MSWRNLHGVTSVIYALEETYLLSSEILRDEWHGNLAHSVYIETAWWQKTLGLSRAESFFAKIDRPSGIESTAEAVCHHFSEGGVDVSVAADGQRLVGFGADSLKLVFEKEEGAPLEDLLRLQWDALRSCATDRAEIQKQLRALQSISDPARVAHLTAENKRLAARIQKLESENSALQRYAQGGRASGSSKKGGPPPAKKQKGSPNLMQPGRALTGQKAMEFASSDDEEQPERKRAKADSETEEEE